MNVILKYNGDIMEAIKTILEIRAEKEDKIFKDSIKNVMNHIHGGVTANDPYVDTIFIANTPSDYLIMNKLNTELRMKGYRITEMRRDIKPRNVKFDGEKHFREYTEISTRIYIGE